MRGYYQPRMIGHSTNLQPALPGLYNGCMIVQTATVYVLRGLPVAEPEEPPPLVRTNVGKPTLEEQMAHQDAEDRRQWEMEEIRDKTKQLKGLFANRAYIDPDGKHLRISFGEHIGDEDVYHSAVVMPLEEAYELGELLTRMGAAGLQVMWERQKGFLADNPNPLGGQADSNG